MAAACGTAALGKRKRSSRITLDEDDTEGEFARNYGRRSSPPFVQRAAHCHPMHWAAR